MSSAAWAAALLIPTLSTWMPAAWGSGGPGAQGDKINACELVSVGEAREVLGTEVTTKPIDTSAAGPDAAAETLVERLARFAIRRLEGQADG